MKFNIFFLILLLISTTACSNCKNIEGKYSTHGGSESMTYLNLLKGNKFILKHESWQPGDFKNKETINSHGSWTCSDNHLTLSYSNLTHKSEYLAVGENPLGINSTTMVLHFKATDLNHFLSNEILYPISSLNN
jgi:hypothetical protein